MADGTIGDVWNIVNTGGVVAVLFWNLYRYQKGDVISRDVHDKIMESQEANTKLMASEILLGIQDAVRLGMIEAYREINGKGN